MTRRNHHTRVGYHRALSQDAGTDNKKNQHGKEALFARLKKYRETNGTTRPGSTNRKKS